MGKKCDWCGHYSNDLTSQSIPVISRNGHIVNKSYDFCSLRCINEFMESKSAEISFVEEYRESDSYKEVLQKVKIKLHQLLLWLIFY